MKCAARRAPELPTIPEVVDDLFWGDCFEDDVSDFALENWYDEQQEVEKDLAEDGETEPAFFARPRLA